MKINPVKILKRFSVTFFFCTACIGGVEWDPMSCGFDPEAFCGMCSNDTIHCCVCQLIDMPVEFKIDEGHPCEANYACGLCPAGSISLTPATYDCPGDPSVPAEDYNVCSSWDPDALITEVSTNNFVVDVTLISSILYDPVPLYGCDSARVNIDSGDLIVEDAVSTDMVYLLGLRNGDQLVEINSMPLNGPKDAAAAYAELWLTQGESEYTLKVWRSPSYVYLNYELLFSNP